MNSCIRVFTLTATVVVGAATALSAEDTSMARDLKVTIALQGQPCDQIVSSTRTADSDYLAVCKDDNRYHVYVDAKGRVVVDKL
jgi:hypothetical protein